MKIGTKSLLFGVHQFLWHPISVGMAWKTCYGKWPKWNEWVAIFCHDIGYWGKPNMDGVEGRSHPERGAYLTYNITCWVYRHIIHHPNRLAWRLANDDFMLSLLHSTNYAKAGDMEVSKLYLPDKVSILFEPRWWYLLRSKLSGEVYEYVVNAPEIRLGTLARRYMTPREWFNWYRQKIKLKLGEYLCEKSSCCSSGHLRVLPK